MILGFLFFIQTFFKHCKVLSTEKYKRYINILLLLFIMLWKPVNIKNENNNASVYVGSSLTMLKTFFCSQIAPE